jgi:mannan endo-1,4-beta-mannosidase
MTRLKKFGRTALGATWLSIAGAVACAAAPLWGVALEGNPITAPQLAAVASDTVRPPQLVVFFQQWPEDPAAREFPRASLDAIAATGAEPVVTWEPMFYRRADGAETMIAAQRIVGGDYDGYITAFAREAAAWGRPLIVRFAHEMNLNRYHWGGPAADYGPASPEKFRAMWRHVVEIFRREKATKVRWAFSPNCESVPGAGNPAAAPWNTARAYYPGDEFVDVLGMDGYNWGNTQTLAKHGWNSAWRSFAGTFGALHAELRALAPGKPVYVFETACAPTGGDRAAWLAELATTVRTWRLEGVVWFEANKEVDWRLRPGLQVEALAPLRAVFPGAR